VSSPTLNLVHSTRLRHHDASKHELSTSCWTHPFVTTQDSISHNIPYILLYVVIYDDTAPTCRRIDVSTPPTTSNPTDIKAQPDSSQNERSTSVPHYSRPMADLWTYDLMLSGLEKVREGDDADLY
jgi:hypothetical protein